MKFLITKVTRPMATWLLGFASILSIAMAKFERDPQNCGTMLVELKRKSARPCKE